MVKKDLPAMPPPPTNGNKTAETKTVLPTVGKLDAVFKPPKILLNAVEGYGKTTFGSYAPNPVMLQARGETGYETLLGSGLVPSIDAARINSWPGLLELMPTLNGFATVNLDAVGGIERLCHEFICDRDFDGEWGEKGFASYQKGYDVSITEWIKLLSALDRLHDKGVVIVILSHCKVKPFKNPMGADYDRYVSDVHDKTWAVTAKWADAVLFGNFFTVVETARSSKPEALRKGKGIGGTGRVIYTERRDAFDAKNRYNMEPVIDIPNDPKQMWSTIWGHITNGKDVK